MRDTADYEQAQVDYEDPLDKEMATSMVKVGALHNATPSVYSMLKAEDKALSSHATSVKMHDGSLHMVNIAGRVKESYRDEYTNGVSPSAWARDAIFNERDYVEDDPIDVSLYARDAGGGMGCPPPFGRAIAPRA